MESLKWKNKNIIIIGFIISIAISFTFSIAYKYDNEIVKKINISNINKDVPEEYKYYLDLVNIEDGYLTVKGWGTKLGENLEYIKRSVILIDENNITYEMNTIMEKRPEVTEAFSDGFNYDNSGIYAKCPIKQFKYGEKFKVGYIFEESNGSTYYTIFDKTITIGSGDLG